MELGKDDQGLMTEGGGAGVSVWFARAAGTKSTKQWAALVVVVQSLSHVRLFATPWTATRQALLSFTIFQSLLQHMSIEPVMSSNHLILYHPLFLLPSIFLSIRVFSNELALRIRWPKYWSSVSASVLPMNIQD